MMQKLGIHSFIDGMPSIGEKYIDAKELTKEYLNNGPEQTAKIDGSWCALIIDEKKIIISISK